MGIALEGTLLDAHRAVVPGAAYVMVDGEAVALDVVDVVYIDVVDEFLVGRIDHCVLIAHVVDVGLDVLHQSALELFVAHLPVQGLQGSVCTAEGTCRPDGIIQLAE